MERTAPTSQTGTRLRTFKGAGITLAYPSTWQTLDPRQVARYHPSLDCLLVAGDPADGTNFVLGRMLFDQEAALEEVDGVIWADVQRGHPDVRLESCRALRVSGTDAVERLFSSPAAHNPGKRMYSLQIHIVVGRAVYFIYFAALSAGALAAHQQEIEHIVSSALIES